MRLTGTSEAVAFFCGLIAGVLIVLVSYSPSWCTAQSLEQEPMAPPQVIPDKALLPPDKNILNLDVDRVQLRPSSPDDIKETLLKVAVPKGEMMTMVLVDGDGRETRLLIAPE